MEPGKCLETVEVEQVAGHFFYLNAENTLQ